MKTKLMLSAELFAEKADFLQCPHCSLPLRFVPPYSMECLNGHHFDLAKPGYLFLLKHGIATKYEATLFEARRRIIMAGFFSQLTNELARLASCALDKNGVLLDAGSGEGSQLIAIKKKLGVNHTAVGIDIAKEGIRQAARDSQNALFLVADLANIPIQDETIHVLLNILSPSNYREFKRVLNGNGILIKVVPEENYLQEIRHFFYQQNDFSNENVLARFAEFFTVIKSERLTYECELDTERLNDLLMMTPLGWHLAEKDKARFLEVSSRRVTADFRIIIGRKKLESE
ncbi:methyltransferase domain-containing protein [Listeria sp. PSOL-1]|uniref:methyltransferase domain-containing protein n=1 Tax=Listeria sp. PSOL-1 TaxID=1844999 RepID=UPI0013D867FB|nr:methyltransferase domain-containing protein [Listeria sp. PSOL-1]